MEDGRCKLGLAGRLQLVRLIEGGCSLRLRRAESSVSPATAHRWWHRWQAASEAERAIAGVSAGAPAGPALVSVAAQRARPSSGSSTRGSAPTMGRRGWPGWSAVAARRSGRCWLATAARGAGATPRERSSRRYEWAEPGALLHMDTKRLQRFHAPGHWATGDRRELARNRGAGYVYAHCVVDDHTPPGLRRAAQRRQRPGPPRSRCAAPRSRGCASRAPARLRR